MEFLEKQIFQLLAVLGIIVLYFYIIITLP
jgi:hypothetical protein